MKFEPSATHRGRQTRQAHTDETKGTNRGRGYSKGDRQSENQKSKENPRRWIDGRGSEKIELAITPATHTEAPVHEVSSKQQAAQRQASSVANDQFVWLRQVTFDHDLPPAAPSVAIGLTKYFNYTEHDGWSWMSQAALAHDLGMSERTVRDALAALVERAHLVIKRRGKMETNLYHLALKQDAGDQSETSDRREAAGHDQQTTACHHGVTGKTAQSDRAKFRQSDRQAFAAYLY